MRHNARQSDNNIISINWTDAELQQWDAIRKVTLQNFVTFLWEFSPLISSIRRHTSDTRDRPISGSDSITRSATIFF